MAGAPEERYKAAMANAVKTIKSQKEQIAELEARLKAAEDALGVERARVQELELALKRKRDSDMDVDGGGGGGGGDDDDDDEEDWDGRPKAKKGRTAPPPQQKPASTKGAVSSLDILSMGKGGGGGTRAAAASGARGRTGKEKEGAGAGAAGAAKGKGKEEGKGKVKAERPPTSSSGGSRASTAAATATPAPASAVLVKEEKGEAGSSSSSRPQPLVPAATASPTMATADGAGGAGAGGAGAGTILEEVAQLWGMVKDKPFADAKFAQLCVDRYVLMYDVEKKPPAALDAGVQRVVLLLREAGHISPQEACRRLLVTYKRRMELALRRVRGGLWLRQPLPRDGGPGRVLGVAAALALRLCDPESYGAYFLELVLDELLQQMYKVEKAAVAGGGVGVGASKGEGDGEGEGEEDGVGVGGEEEDAGDDDGADDEDDDKGKRRAAVDPDYRRHRNEAFRRQREGFAAALLYAALCRATRQLGRCRALVYDTLALNGKGVALAQLAAVWGLWPAVVGPVDGLMARALFALAHEAYVAQRRQHVQVEGEGGEGISAVCWASELAFERLAGSVMGLRPREPEAKPEKEGEGEGEEEDSDGDDTWKAMAAVGGAAAAPVVEYEGVPAVEAVADEALAVLQGAASASAGAVGEAVRALVLLCAARPLAWGEERVLQPLATGEASTPPGVMRLLAAAGRELALRDAVERRSGDVMRRLLLCFSEAIAAAGRRLEGRNKAAAGGGLDGASDWLEDDDQAEAAAAAATAAEEEDGDGGVDKGALREVQLWACKGLADLPGIGVGELKPVVHWGRALVAGGAEEGHGVELTAAAPGHVLRTLVYSQARPHCVALVRERGAAGVGGGFGEGEGQSQTADLELQAILHDVSVRAVQAAALGALTNHAFRASGSGRATSAGAGGAASLNGDGAGAGGPAVSAATRERNRALWAADGGLEHVAVWHMYANSRMDELDYLNRKPSEAVLLEGDAVGSPLLGTELRSVLFELRYRPFPWDVLCLCFVPPSQAKPKVSPYAAALPKGAHPSRRGYVLSHTGAVKLLRAWDQYESVEALLAGEARAGRLTVLIPGDARAVVHPSEAEKLLARASARVGGGRGASGGVGGGGGLQAPEPLPFGFGQGMQVGVPAEEAPLAFVASFPGFAGGVGLGGDDGDGLERPPSPGFRPSDD